MVSAGANGEAVISGGARTADYFFSELARDTDLAELVELFVEELPERIARIKQAAAEFNWEEVCRLAHQLKGAGGSHGFPQITAAACEVERAARELESAGVMARALAGLEGVCGRVRAGVPV